jgi:hypothetical protein
MNAQRSIQHGGSAELPRGWLRDECVRSAISNGGGHRAILEVLFEDPTFFLQLKSEFPTLTHVRTL